MTNLVSFHTANYVARQTGFAMHGGWGEGDRTTNDWFRPLETYRERLDELLREIRGLGFEAVDVWGAHLNIPWATEEHVAIAQELLAQHGLRVASYAPFVNESRGDVEKACRITRALGTDVIGGSTSAPREVLVPALREHGVRFGYENHPERSAEEILAKIGDAPDVLGAAVDTGWWATQSADPVREIEALDGHLFLVHLKGVLAPGAHETCRWGRGVVDAEACVRALQRLGYEGAISIEHEPELYDPSDDCRAMREQLAGWLS